MKLAVKSLLLVSLAALPARAEITTFTHIVVIVQENRTPDNLFQGLCQPPFGTSSSCSTTPTSIQYNVQTAG